MAQGAAVRRTATGLFWVGVAVFLIAAYVGLVYYENTIGMGAGAVTNIDLFTWFLVFAVILVLILIALLLLYFLPNRAAEPLPEPTEFQDEPSQYEVMPPLETEALDVTPVAPATEMDAVTEALLVKCTNCGNEFELPYSTERPLHGTCPSCGEEAVLEEGEDVLTTRGQPVIDLEGIGETQARKLAEAGITTTEQLRVASVARLAAQTGIPRKTLSTWQSMADLLRLKGIGKQYAELLARAGIKSANELAQETPEHLASRLKAYIGSLDAPPVKGGVDAKLAKRWITAARKGSLDAGL